MTTTARHWIEPLQILEKIGKPEGLRAFVQDGLECGFNRPEVAELYGTYFEDRLAETLALGAAAGAYPDDAEFTRRLADVLHVPHALFVKGGPGRKALPVDENYVGCFREAAFAVEAAFHRYIEGDYEPGAQISSLLREAYNATLIGNLARAFDRVTVVGAHVLEGGYLAKPTEWFESEPLYSWLLGLERLSHVIGHLDGWPGGRFASWSGERPKELAWLTPGTKIVDITPARRDVLRMLASEAFGQPALARVRRNRRWIGPELLRLLRMPDDDTTPTVIRNAVRGLGAIEFKPAVDDILGLLMRLELDDDDNAGLAEACAEALRAFGPPIKPQLLHHFELALVDNQRLAIARILAVVPNDDEVMEVLEHFAREAHEMRHRVMLLDLVAGYRHPRSRSYLREELVRAKKHRQHDVRRHLEGLIKAPPRRVRSPS